MDSSGVYYSNFKKFLFLSKLDLPDTALFFVTIIVILTHPPLVAGLCLFVVNPCVLSANRVDFGHCVIHTFSNFTPPKVVGKSFAYGMVHSDTFDVSKIKPLVDAYVVRGGG